MRGDILKAGGAALICTCVGAGVSACAMVSETSSMPTVPPKASVGGPIGLVRDGDMITIDISRRSLVLHVTDDEMERRKAAWKPIAPKVDSRYLHRYSQQVGSVWEGAVWKDPQDLSPA